MLFTINPVAVWFKADSQLSHVQFWVRPYDTDFTRDNFKTSCYFAKAKERKFAGNLQPAV